MIRHQFCRITNQTNTVASAWPSNATVKPQNEEVLPKLRKMAADMTTRPELKHLPQLQEMFSHIRMQGKKLKTVSGHQVDFRLHGSLLFLSF